MSQIISSFHSNQPITTIWSSSVIIATIGLLISGSLSTVGFKYLSTYLGYKHGFIQTLFMFLGEYLNIIMYAICIIVPSWRRKHFLDLLEYAKENNLSFKFTCLWMALTSLLDAVGGSLQIVSILLMPASIYQMLCGGIVISAPIMSRILLKNIQHRHHV